jgi:hypothetical protein
VSDVRQPASVGTTAYRSNGDSNQDSQYLSDLMEIILGKIDEDDIPFQLQESPDAARRHGAMNHAIHQALPLVEDSGSDHCGDTLAEPARDVFPLGLDDSDDRMAEEETLWREGQR